MALEPDVYGAIFSCLPIWTIENGFQFIDASRYLSTGTDRKGNKQKVWAKLQAFLRDAANPETKIPYQQGEWIVDSRIKLLGRVKYSWANTLGPFNGKGTPERYLRFLKAVDFWLTVGCRKKIFRPASWETVSQVPDLKQFAKDYMGVDCNCFVGGYFQQNYPDTGWHVETSWDNDGFYKGPKRLSVADIKPLDVLVLYNKWSDKHVALIGKVLDKTGSRANITVVQSAGSKGGVWSGNCSIEITPAGNAIVSGGYNRNFNKGVYGVIGANC